MKTEEKKYDVVVIGGGFAGLAAAVASARHGARTALVQDRPMFGGTGSSEMRMHVVGASCHMAKKNVEEGGILEEMLLENKWRNPTQCFSVFDTVLWQTAHFQKNLDCYLNTTMHEVRTEGKRIVSVTCWQMTTEKGFVLSAPVFVDATGHGTLAVLAGSSYRYGSEAKSEFGEPSAPSTADKDTMGNSLLFQAVDTGHPVPYIKPDWAYTYTEKDLQYRTHVNRVGSLDSQGRPIEWQEDGGKALPDFSRIDSGYWWIELSSDRGDIIGDAEEIRDELLKSVYGVWDHLKNQGDHGAANYALDWVGILPGKRESRRIVGHYTLTENDVRSNRVFPDAVAYGGWPMDMHASHGLKDLDKVPSVTMNFDGIYTIPYRCYCAKDVENLMLAGRDISTSKLAYGSTRVMATCAIGGQAVGTAAAYAAEKGILPIDVEKDIRVLQRQLQRDDLWLPGIPTDDPEDLARDAKVTATSAKKGCEPSLVVNGQTRIVGDTDSAWESLPLGGKGEGITLILPQERQIKEVRIFFDPDFTQELMPSLSKAILARQPKGLPGVLVRSYTLNLKKNGKTVWSADVPENRKRMAVHCLEEPLAIDTVEVRVHQTWGHPAARIYEVMLF